MRGRATRKVVFGGLLHIGDGVGLLVGSGFLAHIATLGTTLISTVANTRAPTASGSGGGGDDRRLNKKPLTPAAKEAEEIHQKEKKKRQRARDAEHSGVEPTELSAAIRAACQLAGSSDDPRFHPVYWLRRGFQLGVAQRIASQGDSQGSNVHQEANTAFNVAMEEALSSLEEVNSR
ncbi:hypothetical protein N7528_002894 [Penicillium herquei]|nr:hypothetical protein N7528_002894 [Penicillium herquei]